MYGCGIVGVSGGILPQGKFEFLGYIRWYLRPFWTIQG